MIAYNPKKKLKYCDLQCYHCEGYFLKECLMNDKGFHMRMLMLRLMANGELLSAFQGRDYWSNNFFLSGKIVDNQTFPFYPAETCH